MKSKNKFLTKILSLLTLVFMGFCAMSFTKANAVKVYAETGNRYGDIYWSISGSTLTISPVPGTNGVMSEIESYDYAPWYYVNGNYSYDTIKSIIIEDGVTNIAKEAFCYFDKITKIVIPESCRRIGSEAFYNCENLKEAIIYGDVGIKAFAYCYSLEKVTIINNESGKYIAEKAFYNCENLKEATICAQDIEDDAFCYCYSLENLTLLEGCKNIGNEAFYKCQALTYLSLPSTLSVITREAFYDCRNLKEVTYNGSRTDFNKITFDTEYNDVIVEALNNINNRKFVYKSIKPYNYINEQGEKVALDGLKENCFYLTTSTTELKDAWYIVKDKLDFEGKTIIAYGNVKILLLDNCGIGNLSRVEVYDQSTLYIYSESLDENIMGYLNATSRESLCAAIGNYFGNNVTINICGGNITANAGNGGAGIGTGSLYHYNSQVNIYGGNITANGGYQGAGIGSGRDTKSTVNIYGGNIKAKGGEEGAGIGAGSLGNCTVNISGGTVYAKGNTKGAGIGTGSYGNSIVNISGGNIEAVAGNNGASIGCGFNGTATVTLTNNPTINAARIGSGGKGNCIVNDLRDGKNNGTGTLLSNGSVVIISVVGAIALITCGVFVVLYIREKKKKGSIN